MMQMFKINGNEVFLIYGPREEVEVGENIKVWDAKKERGLILQVIEIGLVDLPGILEDLIRNESIPSTKIVQNLPDDLKQFISEVRNVKGALAKVRKEIKGKDEDIVPWTGWAPNREATIEVVDDSWLISKLKIGEPFPIFVGNTAYGKSKLNLSAYDIQEGGTTVIIGKKGTGKSHAAKMLLLGLIGHGARCIIFDVNDEYSGLSKNLEDKKSDKRIVSLNAGDNLQFLLKYIGLDVFTKVLRKSLGTGQPSIYEVSKAWRQLSKGKKPITLNSLLAEMRDGSDSDSKNTNKSIVSALERRFVGLQRTGLLTDDGDKATTLENELKKITRGGAIVFNLKGKSSEVVNTVVATVLSKLESILEHNRNYPPVFLFAEEAHLYIGDTDWENIITRMRHLGTFQFYITNTPTELPEMLIRQTDNLFLFNLQNNEDFTHVTPAIRLDNETTTAVAKSLPPRTCLVVGTSTREFPFVIKTPEVKYAAGETRRFFKFENGKASIAETGGEPLAEEPKQEEEFAL
jgi:uncharacterized protein